MNRKRILSLFLVVMLVVSGIMVPSGKAEAKSSYLTFAKVKATGGKYKKTWNQYVSKKALKKAKKEEKKKKTSNNGYWDVCDTTGEKSPKSCLKLSTGITLLSSKSDVIKKYGEDYFDYSEGEENGYKNYWVKHNGKDFARYFNIKGASRKLILNADDMICYHSKNHQDLTLYFLFKDNKVVCIIGSVNYLPYDV